MENTIEERIQCFRCGASLNAYFNSFKFCPVPVHTPHGLRTCKAPKLSKKEVSDNLDILLRKAK